MLNQSEVNEMNQKTDHYDDQFFNDIEEGSIASARTVVPVVLELIRVHSVVDFGCGRGAWLKVFRENGIEILRGLDGPYVDPEKLLIAPGEFSCHDLCKPVRLDRRYDLATSLEVAEHLPARAARTLVESLVTAAPIVLFSAAIPGQGGTNHINEQWPGYWERIFASFGYRRIDAIRPRIVHDARVKWWYRQNLLLYAQNDILRELQNRVENERLTPGHDLELISAAVLGNYQSFRGLLKETVRAGSRALKLRLTR